MKNEQLGTKVHSGRLQGSLWMGTFTTQ